MALVLYNPTQISKRHLEALEVVLLNNLGNANFVNLYTALGRHYTYKDEIESLWYKNRDGYMDNGLVWLLITEFMEDTRAFKSTCKHADRVVLLKFPIIYGWDNKMYVTANIINFAMMYSGYTILRYAN